MGLLAWVLVVQHLGVQQLVQVLLVLVLVLLVLVGLVLDQLVSHSAYRVDMVEMDTLVIRMAHMCTSFLETPDILSNTPLLSPDILLLHVRETINITTASYFHK